LLTPGSATSAMLLACCSDITAQPTSVIRLPRLAEPELLALFTARAGTRAQREPGSARRIRSDGPIPIAAWAASAGYVRQNPEVAAAFQRAIVKGQTDTTDRSLVEQTVTSTTKVDPQVATLMRLGSWPTTLSLTRMRRVLDLMRTNGAVNTDIDLNAMIFRPALGGP
jgi:NitT/TauT family transport system substrate-binding protein